MPESSPDPRMLRGVPRQFGRITSAVLVLAVATIAAQQFAARAASLTPTSKPAGGLVAVAEHRASTGTYGSALIAGCTWATWVSDCSNLTVYGNGSSFDDNGCGAPNGCTFGSEFQCNELAQRYAYYAWGEPATWYGYGGDQGSAYQMWNAGPALPVPLTQFANGGGVPPQVGDLMIFNQGWLGSYWDGTGHVAIVSSVNAAAGYVDVVEQNATPSGSDQFALSGSTVTANGYTPVMGWLRPQSVSGPIDLSAALGSTRSVAPSPQAMVTADGAQHAFFATWLGHIAEATERDGVWAGPDDWSLEAAAPDSSHAASPPAAVLQAGASGAVLAWQGANGHLWEAADPDRQFHDLTAMLNGAAGSDPSGTPAVVVHGDQLLIFYRGADGNLWEAGATNGAWGALRSWGPSMPAGSQPASTPAVGFSFLGSQQLLFWQGTNGHLWESWYGGGAWSAPADWSASLHAPAAAALSSAPLLMVSPTGAQQLVFWDGGNGHLWEASYGGGRWSGPSDISATLGALPGAALRAAPSGHLTAGTNRPQVLWASADGHIYQATDGASGWQGPADLSAQLGAASATPAVGTVAPVLTPIGEQLAFWTSATGELWEAWSGVQGQGWKGAADLSIALSSLASPPVAVAEGSGQAVLWRTSVGHLLEASSGVSGWQGPVDLTEQLGQPTGSLLQSTPAVVARPMTGGVIGAGLARQTSLSAAGSSVIPVSGSTELVVAWQGADGHIWVSSQSALGWQTPQDLNVALSLPAAAAAASSPGLVIVSPSRIEATWAGTGGDVFAAWYDGSVWRGGDDLSNGAPGSATSSRPSVAVVAGQANAAISWQGANGDLWAAVPNGAGWAAAADVSVQLQAPAASALTSAPVASTDWGQAVVFWTGSNGDIWEAWYGGSWSGVADISAQLTSSTTAATAPALTVDSLGEQILFWQGSDGSLREAWYNRGWFGAWDWSATTDAPPASASTLPPATIFRSGQYMVFWQSATGDLWEAWATSAP